MTKPYLLVVCIVVMYLVSFSLANAHPGRTDGNGGHTCRTNCIDWGLEDNEYHQHNSDGSYTNSKGESYDKSGNIVLSELDVPEPELDEYDGNFEQNLEPIINDIEQAQEEIDIIHKPEPSDEMDLSTDTSDTSSTDEVINDNNQPIIEESEDYSSNDESDEEGGAGAVLGTLAVLGGGGYYLVKKARKKK